MMAKKNTEPFHHNIRETAQLHIGTKEADLIRFGTKEADSIRYTVREAALLSLDAIERSAAYSNTAIERSIRRGRGGALETASPTDWQFGRGHHRDDALLRELVYGVTKWKLTLDAIIFSYSKIKKNKVSPTILSILRMGAYQIIFLDKIPVSAACNESVELAKKYGNDGSVRFVNAILRKIARCRPGEPDNHNADDSDCANLRGHMDTIEYFFRGGGERLIDINAKYARAPDNHAVKGAAHCADEGASDSAGPAASYLSARYSYPLWICGRWLDRYGYDFAAALMDAGNRTPELSIRANSLQTSVETLKHDLEADGFEIIPGRYSTNALTIVNPSDFSSSPKFKQGLFTVQDESSMLAVEALEPAPGEKIFDLCAAPGGKCGYVAEITNNKANILAADIRPHRLALMEQNMNRLGHKSINYRLMDATEYDANLERSMDKVLLDAPCTGLGVIRRKPEIKWSKGPETIKSIVEVQFALLGNAARYLKRGGVLVYSVCTTEPEECEEMIQQFLSEAGDFEPDDLSRYLPPVLWMREPPHARNIETHNIETCNIETCNIETCNIETRNKATRSMQPEAIVHAGANRQMMAGVYLYPHIHATDGFYIARLKRL